MDLFTAVMAGRHGWKSGRQGAGRCCSSLLTFESDVGGIFRKPRVDVLAEMDLGGIEEEMVCGAP